MKAEIMTRFSGQCCTIDDIVRFTEALNAGTPRGTVIWNVNDLVKQGKAVRIGRGVYEFAARRKWHPTIGELARSICSLLAEDFKYLDVTVTDSCILGLLMNMQPFSSVVVIETRKTAVDAVLLRLRNKGIEAYAKKDFKRLEKYITASQYVLIRPELSVNPALPKEKNVYIASIEKILVDLVCDADIYGQYQGEELKNIYQNAASDYAVNYSQILRYAAARKRKAAVLECLRKTTEYQKVEALF